MTRIFVGTIILFASLFSSAAAQNNMTQRLFEKGLTEARNADFATALTDFEASRKPAIEEHKSNRLLATIHFNVGACLYRLGRSAEAESELTAAIRLYDGPYEKASYALGMTEIDLKNMPAARKAFLAALKANPKNGEAWFDLAFVYLDDNDMDAAGDAFRRSIEYGTISSAVSHNNVGVTLVLKEDFAAAEKEFVAALAESNGTLEQAKMNLEYCRSHNKSAARFVARLEGNQENKAYQ
jgi:Flp pilus assembly protein TadD